ncbi:glycosyltransferase family 2 protein [Myroides odoratimimus]|uniref:glycosyltransferase family 2 protein n=1 Tax=Myroides odoratimimus TaxID=76832 RepID=UPI002575F676|nr:glycosyltransferase [Myroides odoratimimus]MDM1514307.1 glycosyltransferase [Myroides odoratimimus]MEC4043994.1 glycosyltransferase [Myroides odoratimimus]MEC4151824.1 glycosyltransferase [Myroides odoratimimus]
MKLSIIIALYNTEKYIEQCIRSIYLNNTLGYKEFEVIVINDGSTDSSRSIIESLIKEFSNIIIIDKSNGGQSSARNIGFLNARGEYILCLDSDDFINGSYLESILKKSIENNIDIGAFKCVTVDDMGKKIDKNKFNYNIGNIESKSVEDFYFKEVVLGAMCFYLYKRDILVKNDLKLHEGIRHEDEEFVTKFFSVSDLISFYDVPLYYYRIHNASSMNVPERAKRIILMFDILKVINELNKHQNKLDKNKSRIFVNKKCNELLVSVYLKAKGLKLTRAEKIELFQKIDSIDLPNKGMSKYLGIKKNLFLFLLRINFFRNLYFI